MELKQAKEYQTMRLFAILGLMTLMVVFLLQVVLFGPKHTEQVRQPAENITSTEVSLNPYRITSGTVTH